MSSTFVVLAISSGVVVIAVAGRDRACGADRGRVEAGSTKAWR